MKRATSVNLDVELLVLLKKEQYNISALANELLWMVVEGKIPQPKIKTPIRVTRLIVSLETMLKRYLHKWKDPEKTVNVFVEDRLASARTNPTRLYGEPSSPFHSDEEFKEWCKKIIVDYTGEEMVETGPPKVCSACGKICSIDELAQHGKDWFCPDCYKKYKRR